MAGRWIVWLSATAEADYVAILRWTAEHFGPEQHTAYAETLAAALSALIEGPEIPGAKTRSELGKGLRTLHVARGGRRGRHFILFRVGAQEGRPAIEVLRLLHDSMDLARHLPPEERET